MIDDNLFSDITREFIKTIHHETKKPNNKKRINYLINFFTSGLLKNINPYLYTILAILVLMFIMNCFNFYRVEVFLFKRRI